jgi:hypothetical protein
LEDVVFGIRWRRRDRREEVVFGIVLIVRFIVKTRFFGCGSRDGRFFRTVL